MKKQILKSFVIVLSIALLTLCFLSALIFTIHSTNTTTKELKLLAQSFKQNYEVSNNPQMLVEKAGEISKDIRITIIDKDGDVLIDSFADEAKMENHLNREEIVGALKGNMGVSVRSSETISQNMMYVAVVCDDGNYLRISKKYPSAIANVVNLLPILFICAFVCFIVAFMVSSSLADSITSPLQTLSKKLTKVVDSNQLINVEKYPYEELQTMAQDINLLQDNIKYTMNTLENEKIKINYILDNMQDGFILLDDKHRILIFNKSAKNYLDCKESCVGKNIIHATRNYEFLDIIRTVGETKKPIQQDILVFDMVLNITVSCVQDIEKTGIAEGLVILICDATQARTFAKMRSDFFSNASHELKTPITSIQGFAEILSGNQDITSDMRAEYAGYIFKESKRITSLINDIIFISRMESGDLTFEKDLVEMDNAIQECCNNVMPLAKQNDVAIITDLQNCKMIASKKQIQTLTENLVSNAVRYNMKGGIVKVSLYKNETGIVLTVYNTGEVIEEKYGSRIFERFFRIDKGRSNQTGGTGLGLSIVKHIATAYKAKVTMQSSKQDGTTFTVCFPA